MPIHFSDWLKLISLGLVYANPAYPAGTCNEFPSGSKLFTECAAKETVQPQQQSPKTTVIAPAAKIIGPSIAKQIADAEANAKKQAAVADDLIKQQATESDARMAAQIKSADALSQAILAKQIADAKVNAKKQGEAADALVKQQSGTAQNAQSVSVPGSTYGNSARFANSTPQFPTGQASNVPQWPSTNPAVIKNGTTSTPVAAAVGDGRVFTVCGASVHWNDKWKIITNSLANVLLQGQEVEQAIWGTNFTPSCEAHDRCYDGLGGTNPPRAVCDNALRRDALTACKLAKMSFQKRCNEWAELYYLAVLRLGEDAFCKARKLGPKCEQVVRAPATQQQVPDATNPGIFPYGSQVTCPQVPIGNGMARCQTFSSTPNQSTQTSTPPVTFPFGSKVTCPQVPIGNGMARCQ